MSTALTAAIIAADVALIVNGLTLGFNAWRGYRDASWRRVERALDLIAAGSEREVRLGWAMLEHQIGDRSISRRDAALIGRLATEFAWEGAQADEQEWTIESSGIVESSNGGAHDE
jgi:hypothetical protein